MQDLPSKQIMFQRINAATAKFAGAKGDVCDMAKLAAAMVTDQRIAPIHAQMIESIAKHKPADYSTRASDEILSTHMTASDLEETVLIFAVGMQMAANRLGNYQPKEGFRICKGEPGAAAFYDPVKEQLAITTLGLVMAGESKYREQIFDHIRKQPEYTAADEKELTGHLDEMDKKGIICAGIEEYCHMADMKNPERFAKLQQDCTARYGHPWPTMRKLYKDAARETGTMESFRENDPIEQSPAALIKELMPQIDEAVAKMEQAQSRAK